MIFSYYHYETCPAKKDVIEMIVIVTQRLEMDMWNGTEEKIPILSFAHGIWSTVICVK